MSLFYRYWLSLNHFATSKSFGKFVSQSAMNGFELIELANFRDWYLIKSGSFCLNTDCMLQNTSFLLLKWRENVLNGFPVIQISDSTMLMQETVISFEVRETKLKVKLCISQSFMQSLCIAKESCFSSKSRVRELLIYR